ncbi:MAG: tetratricopeptide repeat protein [Bacteroidetes bacterium]|jgi:signal transduction histidine kinase/Flp pilus assembly protein TadD|nr:tetratricopeptide repeat protein [Bacteroidota bacterium]
MQFIKALYAKIGICLLFLLVACKTIEKRKTHLLIEEENEKAAYWINVDNDSALLHANRALQLAITKNDTLQQIKSLSLQAEALAYQGNVNQAIRVFKQAIELAKAHQQYDVLTRSMMLMGEQFYNKGLYDKSLLIFLDAVQLSRRYNITANEALGLHYMGKYYHTMGKMDESIAYYEESLELAIQTGNAELQVSLYNKIGKHFETIGNYTGALGQYIKADSMTKQIDDKVLIGTTYNHLGNIYHILENLDKALHYHTQAYLIRKELAYTEGEGKSLKNIGEIFETLGQYDTARACYQKSLLLCEQVKYKKGQIKASNNLGRIYWINGDDSTAFYLIHRAFNMAEEVGYVKGQIKAANDLAGQYLQIEVFDKAEYYLLQTIELAQKEEFRNDLRKSCELLYQMHDALGNKQRALHYVELYIGLNDYFFNEQRNKKLAEMQVAYELDQQEHINELLRKENELKNLSIQRKNQFILLYTFILVLLAGIIGLIVSRMRQKNKANRMLNDLNHKVQSTNQSFKKLNKELNRINYEKDRLFSIISHEMRNPLFWTKNLVELLSQHFDTMTKNEIKHTLQSLDESAKATYHLMDNLLNWSKAQLNRIHVKAQLFSINELIEEKIMHFNPLATQKNIQLQTSISKPIQAYADPEMVKLVMRNLLSNALKFTPDSGNITIECFEKNNQVYIKVHDTGVGINADHLDQLFNKKYAYSTIGLLKEKGNGLGLLLSKEFVERNQGKIWIESTSEVGSVFVFTIPGALVEENKSKIFSAM